MVGSRHRETAIFKLIVIISQRFRIRADVDELWQTVQPGPFSEKQTRWITQQLYLLSVADSITSYKQMTFEN